MTHKWDNKKPTAQMLGRWQPFHDGHYTLFKEIIKKTGQVCIQIRDVQGVDDNPFDFETALNTDQNWEHASIRYVGLSLKFPGGAKGKSMQIKLRNQKGSVESISFIYRSKTVK